MAHRALLWLEGLQAPDSALKARRSRVGLLEFTRPLPQRLLCLSGARRLRSCAGACALQAGLALTAPLCLSLMGRGTLFCLLPRLALLQSATLFASMNSPQLKQPTTCASSHKGAIVLSLSPSTALSAQLFLSRDSSLWSTVERGRGRRQKLQRQKRVSPGKNRGGRRFRTEAADASATDARRSSTDFSCCSLS